MEEEYWKFNILFVYLLQVHRLVVVDDEEKVIGIISLSDLLLYLVLRPCGEDGSPEGVASVRAQVIYIVFCYLIILINFPKWQYNFSIQKT